MRKIAEVMRKIAEVMHKIAEVMRRIAEFISVFIQNVLVQSVPDLGVF